MTKSQEGALRWLKQRGGDGVFDKNGVLLAHGELAPYMRSTWNALAAMKLIEFYYIADKGRGRCRVIT